MNFEFTKILRHHELQDAFCLLKRFDITSGHLLEIGAGAGWQAREISENGFNVKAIDIETSRYISNSVWPVEEYDGYKIPFPENHFDVIFSSNVLEHIPHIEKYQAEITRVLKNSGVAIHIVPTASWRLWTNITHYLYLPKSLFSIIYRRTQNLFIDNKSINYSSEELALKTLSITEIIKKLLLPSRHGEFGNSLTELYYFSRNRWDFLFLKTGWNIKTYALNNLTYSGYLLFGKNLSVTYRKIISPIFGSSCHIYILEKKTI